MMYRDPDGTERHAKFFPLYVNPEPGFPVGRKGFVLAAAWRCFGQRGQDVDGLLILDGDVAIDPVHMTQMYAAINSDPGKVWTAACRIWPVSTHRAGWVWASWEDKASQELDRYPRWFSFNFTYLPRALMDHVTGHGLEKWMYPRVDSNMSAAAQKLGIKAEVVEDCFPVHMHW
jgi:hypothetical protein